MNRLVSWWDAHQIALYLAAMAAGAGWGAASSPRLKSVSGASSSGNPPPVLCRQT